VLGQGGQELPALADGRCVVNVELIIVVIAIWFFYEHDRRRPL